MLPTHLRPCMLASCSCKQGLKVQAHLMMCDMSELLTFKPIDVAQTNGCCSASCRPA